MRSYLTSLLLLVLFCCATVQSGNPRLAQAQTSPPATNNEVGDNTAQTTLSIDRQVSNIDQRIDRLESQIQAMNANLKLVLEKTPTLSEMETENAELRRMLGNFERFFGSLYADKPEAFDPEANVETRMSKLNQYLGNREAELVGLRPSPLRVLDSQETFDPELLGKVLAEITEENSKLAEKVSQLQAKIDITSPSKVGDRDDVTTDMKRRSPRDIRPRSTESDNFTMEEEVVRHSAVEHLEVLLWNLTDSLIPHGENSSSHTTYIDISEDSMTVEDAVDMLAEDLLGIQTFSRGRRKSAFSAASTTFLLGTPEPQIVTFDHIYVNKGRDFDVDKSTFTCEITGFYFISFNLRTYENSHLGVTLMKNDEIITAVYSDASERNVMESQSVILHLESGDQIYLRLGPSERYGIHSDQFRYTTFSGFLLYRGY